MYRKLIFLLTIGCVVASCASYNYDIPNGKPLYPAPSSSFSEIWNVSDMHLPVFRGHRLSAREPFLVLNNKCVIFFGKHITDEQYSLQCLDTLTGDLDWKTELTGIAATVTANTDSIFVVLYQGSVNQCNEQKCDTVLVQAYERETGNIKWEETYEGISTISRIFADDEFVNIKGGGGHGAYTTAFSFIADTGEQLEYQGNNLKFVQDDFYDDMPRSEQERIISNIANDDDTLYYLTYTAILLAKKIEDSKVLGNVYFELNTPALDGTDNYLVAVTEDIVVVYLGGSGQIFSFRFASDE